MHKILITRRIPEIGIQRLQEFFEIELWTEDSAIGRSELLARAKGCSGILSLLSDRIDAEVIDAAGPTLKAIANFAVGFNNIDLQAAQTRKIQVGNTPDALTNATADIAVGLLLAAARQFRSAIDNVVRHEWKSWEPLGLLGLELSNKTLGIVGLGRIGAAVAKRLHHGWNMNVLYAARNDKPDLDRELRARRVSLDQLLRDSDFVSVHSSLNDQTRNLLNAGNLQLMKPTAVLVNTSRGEVIDQDALYEVLSKQKIFAAGLDVTTPEPLPNDSRLRELANCIILPHIGSATIEARDKMAMMAAENLIAAIHGKPMPHPVG